MNEDQLNIQGVVFGVEEILQSIRANSDKKIECVNIICLDTLFLDADLLNPGINTAVIASNWRVHQKTTISLKGSDAVVHPKISADDGIMGPNDEVAESGKNGEPGFPGHSGGCFFGKVVGRGFVTGLDKLTIDVSGGHGGAGQNGGQGAKGRDGKDGDVSLLEEPNPALLISNQV